MLAAHPLNSDLWCRWEFRRNVSKETIHIQNYQRKHVAGLVLAGRSDLDYGMAAGDGVARASSTKTRPLT